MLPLVIDSDIGTYLDDFLAIALAVVSPEVELLAVTTNDGDTTTRARIARRLLDVAGAGEVLVAAGGGMPLLRRTSGNWAGHEGEGLLEGAPPRELDSRHGAQLIVDITRARPGEVTVLGIGAMTNIAIALALEPALPRLVRRLLVMGGSMSNDVAWRETPVAEWNFAADPEAADVVARAGFEFAVVPFDVGARARFRRADVEALRAAGGPLRELLAGQAERALARWQSEETWPFDALAVAMLVDPSLVTTEQLAMTVLTTDPEFAGLSVFERPGDGKAANADVAVDADIPRFERMLLERLTVSS